jgi:hypothetical protein
LNKLVTPKVETWQLHTGLDGSVTGKNYSAAANEDKSARRFPE